MAMMKKLFSFTKVDVSENKNFLHFMDLFAQEKNILRGKRKDLWFIGIFHISIWQSCQSCNVLM